MDKKLIATRDGLGDELVELGKNNKDIYVVDVDIGKSCKTTAFAKAYPEQHVNVGIAEQNGAGLAAGLATCGKIPFVVTYAVFGSLRMCEQIRQEICYPNLNVKIACSHGGVTPANDGASHQCIEDMGVLRTLPNMTVIMPADYWSARKLVAAAAEMNGPCYLRFTRDAIPVIYDENTTFEIGKANLLKGRQGCGHHRQRRHRPSGSGGRRGAGWQGNLRPSAGYAHHQASGRRGGQGLCQRHR